MDWRDPDEPEGVLGVVERQDDPAETWQRARRAALIRENLTCQDCGVEHGRRVWRYLYDRTSWWPIVPGQAPHRSDLGVVDTVLIAIPVAIPWSGEVDDLAVVCMGCYFGREVDQARERKRTRDLRGQQIGLF